MVQQPQKIIFENLVFLPIAEDQIGQSYDAFVESFEALNQYFSPAWAKFETIPTSDEMKEYWLQCIQYFKDNESFLFCVFDKETQKLIGHAELHHYDSSVPKARLGYWVRNDESNKGYATKFAATLTDYAFSIMECERVEIRNDVRNTNSSKIAKRLGYDFLTVFEKNKQGKLGDFWDLKIYALLKHQYQKNSAIEYVYD